MKKGEDFPDLGSRSERTTVKLARTFVTNFFKGKEKSDELKELPQGVRDKEIN